jgi:hypothetical protein
VSPVKYELRLSIPEDGILHSHRRENLKSYIKFPGLTFFTLARKIGTMYQKLANRRTKGPVQTGHPQRSGTRVPAILSVRWHSMACEGKSNDNMGTVSRNEMGAALPKRLQHSSHLPGAKTPDAIRRVSLLS